MKYEFHFLINSIVIGTTEDTIFIGEKSWIMKVVALFYNVFSILKSVKYRGRSNSSAYNSRRTGLIGLE